MRKGMDEGCVGCGYAYQRKNLRMETGRTGKGSIDTGANVKARVKTQSET